VSPKNLALIAAAVAVTVMGVYLFIQVKATPAQAHHASTPSRQPVVPEAAPEPTHETGPAPTPAAARPAPVVNAPSRPDLSNDVATPSAAELDDQRRPNLKLDNLMELANKAYDRQDFDEATAIAGKVLVKDPTNVRMLRVMVSANCIAGDSAVAQEHYTKLPPFDRGQMKTRCDRYGVTLTDPAE
jgi:hypothetical protein